MKSRRALLISSVAVVAVLGLAGGTAWWLSGEPVGATVADGGPSAGQGAVTREAAVRELPATAPHDAPWPPLPSYPRADDPSDDSIVIPASWSPDDQRHAQEWLTAERFTNDCLAARGGTYFYRAFWLFPGPSSADQFVDENGEPRLNEAGDPVPPSDWGAFMQRPSAPRSPSSLACWNQALRTVGRTPVGPTEFAPVGARFEATDFADPSTLDMPSGWDDAQREAGRQEWALELGMRECMAAAGYPTYGDAPRWLVPDDEAPRTTEWLMSFPVTDQHAIRVLLDGAGGDPGSWGSSCAGRVSAELGIDLH